MSKKTARKSATASTEKELRAKLSTLRTQLTASEKKLTKAVDRAERWKGEAKAQKESASQAEARLKKLQRKLDRATADVGVGRVTAAPSEGPTSSPDHAVTPVEDVVPDQSWSVVQLRAEARRRGLVGLSNKPKADLIAALS